MQLLNHLQRRQAEGNPIRVGLVGCGQEGSGMVHITNQMAGLDTAIIADIDLNRPLHISAHRDCRTGYRQDEPSWTSSRCHPPGKRVVTEDALLLPQIECVDAVV